MSKICPFTFRKETVKAMLRGQGDFERVSVQECLGDGCMAYEDGRCLMFDSKKCADNRIFDVRRRTPVAEGGGFKK